MIEPKFASIESMMRQGQFDAAAAECQPLLDNWVFGSRAANVLGVVASVQQRDKDAAHWFQTACGQAPQTAKYHRNLGLALLELGDLEVAKEHFHSALELEGAPHLNVGIFRNILLNGQDNRKGAPYVQKLENVTIETASWTILDGDNIYSRDVADLNLNNGEFVSAMDRDKRHVVMNTPDVSQSIEQPCVFLGGDDNYSHWLTRIMPRLAILDNHPDLRKLPLLTRANLREYERDSLARIGYDESNIIAVERPSAVQLSTIHVPSFPRHNMENMTASLMWFRKHMLAQQPPSDGAPPTRLFVSRKDAKRRRLVNESAIMDALSHFGIIEVVPSELTFAEQVDLFSRAELVVGPHGAGLTNLVFCPAKCGVVEVTCAEMLGAEDLRAIAAIGDLKTAVLMAEEKLSQQIDDSGRPLYSELYIDPKAVLKAVAHLVHKIPVKIAKLGSRNPND
jgi:hypothetical protein